MKKLVVWFGIVAVITAALAMTVPALPQNPQTQTAPLYATNAKYTNGISPGYWPTQLAVGSQLAQTGLHINIGPGTSNCGSGTIIQYAGGTFTMTASATNRIYLNTASSCAPAVKTSAFTGSDIPIAVVVTSGSAITSITDDRTIFNFTSGASVAWGVITGTLSDQTDLQTALNAKAAASSVTTINSVSCPLNGSCSIAASGTNDNLAEVAAQPTPLGTVLLQALNNAKNQVVNIVFLCDSFCDANKQNSTEGPVLRDDLFINRIKTKLESIYHSNGTGLNQMLMAFDTGTVVNSDYYSYTGSLTQVNSLGPTQSCCAAGSALLEFSSGSVITFNDQRGTQWDTLHIYGATSASSGSMSCAIDGGSPISVTNSNYSATGVSNGGYTAHRWDLTPGAVGAHTAICTLTGNFPIYGFQGTNGSVGVSIHNLGIGGAASYAFGADPTNELAFSDLIVGGTQAAILMIQTNDVAHSTPTGTFQTNIQNVITHEQALSSAPTFLLTIPPVDSIASGHAPYTAIQKTLFATNSILNLNIQDRGTTASGVAHGWGITYDAGSGNWDVGDGIHPSTKGHGDMAGLIYGTLVNPTIPPNAVQVSIPTYAIDTGVADVYTASVSPPITYYPTGLTVRVKIAHTNLTTTPTLSVNGIGAKTIVKNASTPVSGGDLAVGEIHNFQYDGTTWELKDPAGSSSTTYAATSPIQVDTGTPGTVRYYCTTCATGGGSKNIYGFALTPPSSLGWSNLNFQTGTTVDYLSGFGWGSFKPGPNYELQGQYTSVSGSTWTHIFGLQGDMGFITKTSMQAEVGWGVFVTDGTQSVTFWIEHSNGSPNWCYIPQYWATANANPPSSSAICDSSGTGSWQAAVSNGNPYYFKVDDDSTHINFSISMDGFHYTQIYQETCSTHFTNCAAITNVGWGSYIYGGGSSIGSTVSLGFFHYQ